MAVTPLERLRHTAARTTAIALTDLLEAMLRPEEQIELCRQAFEIVLSCLEVYDAERSRLN